MLDLSTARLTSKVCGVSSETLRLPAAKQVAAVWELRPGANEERVLVRLAGGQLESIELAATSLANQRAPREATVAMGLSRVERARLEPCPLQGVRVE